MINIEVEYNCDDEKIERYLNQLIKKSILLKRQGSTIVFKMDTILTLDSVKITIPNSDIRLVAESNFF